MTGLPSLPSGMENFSRKSRSGSSRSSCSAKSSSAEKFIREKPQSYFLILTSSFVRWRLHELDRDAVRVTNIHNPLPGVWTCFKNLRRAGSFPTRRYDPFEHALQVIDQQCHVHRADVAGSKGDVLFSIWRREILKQFNFMTAGRF